MEIALIGKLSTAESTIKGTCLITLYVPSDCSLWLVKEHVDKEIKTTANVKNRNVGKAALDALKSVSYQLSILSKIPETGLVVCAGNFYIDNSDRVQNQQCL